MTLSIQSILLIIIDFRFFLWFCNEQSFLCLFDTCIFILGINSNLKLYILFLLQKSHEACSKVHMESPVFWHVKKELDRHVGNTVIIKSIVFFLPKQNPLLIDQGPICWTVRVWCLQVLDFLICVSNPCWCKFEPRGPCTK